MKNQPWWLLLIALYLPMSHAEDAELARIFQVAGANGTMVIASLDGTRQFVHNDSRANTRLPAASTFKILNSLMALDEGAISGPEEVFVWDGHQYDIPDWNRNHTLASAYKASCVWCYQVIASRIAPKTYQAHIQRAGYGQLMEPFDQTHFWLDGSLKISAHEQIEFIRQLVNQSLPYKPASYDAVRDIMIIEKTDTYTIRAKTGWATSSTPQTGWYVGYVETKSGTWLFALNMDIADKDQLPLRQQVTMKELKAKAIIQ
jgi:beta-lactamase class D